MTRLHRAVTAVVLMTCLSPIGAFADTFDVTNILAAGPGSFAQAIAAANGKAGRDTVRFVIPDPAGHVRRINVNDLLISDETLVDGYTQAGAAFNTNIANLPFNGVLKIEISGEGLGAAAALLTVSGSNTEVRGLCFIGAESYPAVRIEGTGPHSLTGCFVGLPANGAFDFSVQNQDFGVELVGQNSTIGGTDAAQRNVIAGNTMRQISITGDDNVVRGNIIGLGPDGSTTIPVDPTILGTGVLAFGDNTLIGGAVGGGRNIISGLNYGVELGGTANIVRRNRIGTDVSGTLSRGNAVAGISVSPSSSGAIIGGRVSGNFNVISGNGSGIWNAGDNTVIRRNDIGLGVGKIPLGNTSYGIWVKSGNGITIGGDQPDDGNEIAYNGGAGVRNTELNSLTTIRRNSIFENSRGMPVVGSGLGIDVGLDGVETNDDPELDGYQNHPALDAVDNSVPGNLGLSGTLAPTLNGPYVIEFFSTAICDSSGYGEGETFLGDFTTNVSPFQTTIAASVPIGHFITATATDGLGNTSEFSECVEVHLPTTVINTNDSGAGSLRWAIDNANAAAGSDTIRFDIPGSGPHVIAPLTELPWLSEVVFLDGTSQPGWSPNTLSDTAGFSAFLPIVLDGSGSLDTGLMATASSTKILGLKVMGFDDGIRLTGNNVSVQGCSVDATNIGIHILGSNNQVGGTLPVQRNTVRNCTWGILVLGTLNSIVGNSVGVDNAGVFPAPNVFGIHLWEDDNDVDGTVAPNFVGGNNQGIVFSSFAERNRVLGNVVGLPTAGNSTRGIVVDGTQNQVGGIGPGEGNTIAYNGGPGILVQGGLDNALRGNSIHDNDTTDLGIDLAPLGVTANDSLDADTGPNGLVNYPTLVLAESRRCELAITGSMDGRASESYTLDFYQNPNCDVLGFGEGKLYLGTLVVVTQPNGTGPFEMVLPLGQPLTGVVTATATVTGEGTSEFSACTPIVDAMKVTNAADSGLGSLRYAIDIANDCPGLDLITFDMEGDSTTIRPATELPDITDPVSILGFTQPGSIPNVASGDQGFNGNVVVGIDGVQAPLLTIGLELRSTGCSVSGLVLKNFYRGVLMGRDGSGGGGGHDVTGCIFRDNEIGALTDSPQGTIGGPLVVHRNVFVGNTVGLMLDSDDNVVEGNLFGTLDGTSADPNGVAVTVDGHGNVIDGTVNRNVISGSTTTGIVVQNDSSSLGVFGNVIGTTADGTADLPNAGDAIHLLAGANVVIGGSDIGNVIAYNGAHGITILSGDIVIGENSIHDNAGLGIDNGNDGVTPNAPADGWPDQPLLDAVVDDGVEIRVHGRITAAPGASVDVYFYENPACDPSGFGEGQEYLGSLSLVVGMSGETPFTHATPSAPFSGHVTANAVVDGRSSEFSPCVSPQVTDVPAGPVFTRLALRANQPNPFNPSTTIVFELPQDSRVQLDIYDVRGHTVRTLVDGARTAGRHEEVWDGRDEAGRRAGSGVYLYRLRANGQERTRRMLLLK